MSTETNHPVPPAPGAPAERYERRDADVGALLKFALSLFLILVAVFLLSRWVFNYYAKTQPLGPAMSPFESGNVRVLPPAPRLQVAPQAELRAYCQAQEQALTTSGWVDQATGVARIPIDTAMQKLLAHGLPVRAGGEAPASSAGGASKPAQPPASISAAGTEFGPCGYLLESDAAARGVAEPESNSKEKE